MKYPIIEIDISKIKHNTRRLVKLCSSIGLEVMGVTKVTAALPAVARAMLEAGVAKLADSRLANLKKLRESGLGAPLYLLRLPAASQAEEVVDLATGSLNSEIDTIKALSRAATKLEKNHRVILMVDLGDLREGIWADDVVRTAREIAGLPGIELEGLGTNLTCFGGVCPTPDNLGRLASLAREVETATGLKLTTVSGGNSSSLKLVQEGRIPEGVTQLRLGESIMLGRETIAREPVPGAYLDAFVITAEVIEVKDKPSVPVGEVGQDAFGNVPAFVDRGIRRRAICALGRQDAVLDGLEPLRTGVEVLGGSSDHLLLDVTEADPPVFVGDRLSFVPGYGCLLAAMTSPYVEKVIKY